MFVVAVCCLLFVCLCVCCLLLLFVCLCVCVFAVWLCVVTYLTTRWGLAATPTRGGAATSATRNGATARRRAKNASTFQRAGCRSGPRPPRAPFPTWMRLCAVTCRRDHASNGRSARTSLNRKRTPRWVQHNAGMHSVLHTHGLLSGEPVRRQDVVHAICVMVPLFTWLFGVV